MSFRSQRPGSQAAAAPPDAPPPARHVDEVPGGDDHGQEQHELLRDEEGEERERDAENEGGEDGRKSEASHFPHDAPVLLRWDLRGVPAPTALLAHPALTIRNAGNTTAVTADRDESTLHVPSLRPVAEEWPEPFAAGPEPGRSGPGR